jgi:hypothetical protein
VVETPDSIVTYAFVLQEVIARRPNTFCINILSEVDQAVLIGNSLTATEELHQFKQFLDTDDLEKTVIVYGRDYMQLDALKEKQKKLVEMGFRSVHIYPGGLFEWLLLQDSYGTEHFPTRGYPNNDLLQYATKDPLVVSKKT